MIKNFKIGKLLIADPSIIEDDIFSRSVILITNSDSKNCIGFMINKPTNYAIGDLLPEINSEFLVYDGGPVEKDNLYFIHTLPHLIDHSEEIGNGIYWGGDFEQTKNLINQNKINKNEIRFFLGYSGWSIEQLEQEMENKSWIIAENTQKKSLLNDNSKIIWKNSLLEIGGEYIIWANAPENPILN